MVVVRRYEHPKADHFFIGLWHITEMEQWDEDYFNMEVQAYIQIEASNQGNFQFGLVTGNLNGKLKTSKSTGKECFTFTWEGCDEMDEVSGSGSLELVSHNELEGEFIFHQGDESTFKAVRIQ